MARSAGARGGLANEGGSLHRGGVAAYLAAYGLAEQGVPVAGYSTGGPAPVALRFETGDAVDDIRCELSDGTCLLLQAKRTCGNDKHLVAAVRQWTAQEPDLQPGDCVGLATRTTQGIVSDLGSALSRRRLPHGGDFSTKEENALRGLKGRFPQGTSETVRDHVLDVAVVMEIKAEVAGDPHFTDAAHLMENVVVAAGDGVAAVRALQQAFREQAAEGRGSGVDDWLRILAEAKVHVCSDRDGPAGPRRQAEFDVVAAHRLRLASRDGMLEYALLADDLPPMRFGGLAESVQVAVSVVGEAQPREDRLLDTARRWPRMLLSGLPGAGKSTALEQLAARWAADATAPVPVLVPLREVARRMPRRAADVTLAVLIEAATAATPIDERVTLREVLAAAVLRGEAVLLLDGLDECRRFAGVVADGLIDVLQRAHPETGVVLAARDSGLAAAAKLQLPHARLTEPEWLSAIIVRLLRHVAEHRVVEGERNAWIQQRQAWIDDARRTDNDPWTVPLLATLMTLIAATREATRLPTGRARILSAAVRDSVERWETLRESAPVGGWQQQIRPGLLVDGYGEIAHALATTGACQVKTALRAVERMLAERWGFAPGEAETHARDVLFFWDEQVGAFTRSEANGLIEPRSRVFAEIGVAMWVARQPESRQREWLTGAASDVDNRDTVTLAAELSPDIAKEMIKAAQPSHHLLSWATDAANEGAELGPEEFDILVRALADMARESPAVQEHDASGNPPPGRPLWRSVEDPAWSYVRRLAALRLPAAMRGRRVEELARINLAEEQRTVADALAVLADAAVDDQQVLEVQAVRAVQLMLDLPIDDPPITDITLSRRYVVSTGGPKPLLSGRVTAAEQAIPYLAQLGEGAAETILRIAHTSSVRRYRRMQDHLASLGYSDLDQHHEVIGAFIPLLAWQDPWEILFKITAEIVDRRAETTVGERWRLPALAALFDALSAREATLVGITAALTVDQHRLRPWIRAVACAARIDLSALAAQAHAAATAWDGGDHGSLDVLFAPPNARNLNPQVVDQDDIDVLIDTLGAESDWLADTATQLLLGRRDPRLVQQIERLHPALTPERRARRAGLIIGLSSDPVSVVLRLLASEDPAMRVGSAQALDDTLRDEPGAADALQRARLDRDMTVRLAAGADQVAARSADYWTCPDCVAANDIAALDCAQCSTGSRPDDHWAA